MLYGNYDKFIQLLEGAEKILLLPHLYADGDALGSCGALAAFLTAAGHHVTVLTGEPVEAKLDFIAGISGVTFLSVGEIGRAKKYDLAVAVDTAAPDRLGNRLKYFEAAGARARIDHHATGTDFSPETLLDPEWSATAEGVYLLLNRMGFDRGTERSDWLTDDVEKAVAGSIYTGLVTDTGCFAYSNVTAQTHYIASRTRAIAGNMSFVSHKVYEVKSLGYTRLMRTVYDKLSFPYPDICLLTLTKEDLAAAGADESDTGGIANILRDIEGVKAGIFIKPDNVPGKFRVSMRSDDSVNVGAIAGAFGGGGHVCAAGCGFAAKTPEQLAAQTDKLLEAVRKEIDGGREGE
ncbi:MAG: bifunctional oligoribonuclease/PAP phosphatase NrnA [Clostridia bacterium]|nr:bifunctional oligoribonuclease/PAP phosphatase NrnA [Clostridia bacterium]